MARITVEDCTEQIENRFALARLAGQRARQLMAGARAIVTGTKDKPTVLALREVATGKVMFDQPSLDKLGLKRRPGPR